MSKIANNEIQANSLADNEIQAKTPEVGDVFYVRPYPNMKRIIVNIIEYKNQVTYSVFNGQSIYEYSISRIKKELKYLGKSKVNISDLFKTENE